MAPFATIVCQKCHFSELVSFWLTSQKILVFDSWKSWKNSKNLCFYVYHMSQLIQREALIFYMLTNIKNKVSFTCQLGWADLIYCICILHIDVLLKYLLPIINKLIMQKNTIQVVHHYLYLQLFFYQYG